MASRPRLLRSGFQTAWKAADWSWTCHSAGPRCGRRRWHWVRPPNLGLAKEWQFAYAVSNLDGGGDTLRYVLRRRL